MNFNGFIIMFRMLALYPVLPAKSMVSRLLELYSLLMILYGCCITIYVFHICHYYSGNTVYDIVGALKVFILIVTHISIVIHAFTSRKTQVDILKMFDHIDSVMVTQLFIKIVPKSISKKFAWEQIAYIAILLASYTHYFICISMYVDNFFVMPIIGTTRMRCVQILFYVGLLQERLEMINDELSKIIKPPAYGHSLFRKAILENENYEKIVILKNLYGCIWEISNMLNDCFGWSFVIMATEQFVEMLSNANVIFIVLVTPELPNSMAMYVLFEGFPSFFTFTIVCIHCHFCSEKALATEKIVKQIKVNSIGDTDFCNILQEFLLQIRHEHIIINANGYFTVNLELLSKNWAIAVMYLLILIQFQQSEPDPTDYSEAGNKSTSDVTAITTISE